MEELFLRVFNMSVIASFCIIIVMLLRLLLRKTPKIFSYALWLIVLVRLLCPVLAESPFGLLPSAREQNNMNAELEDAVWNYLVGSYDKDESAENSQPKTDESITGSAAADLYGEKKDFDDLDITLEPVGFRGTGRKTLLPAICSAIWMTGFCGLAGYSFFSIRKLKKYLVCFEKTEERIYESDKIEMPFLFGLFYPNIYLPQGLKEPERSYIIAHEMVHIRRRDYLIKPTFYLAVCIHWFNPFVWAAWLLMCRDMEMSCDEAVIKKLGTDIKKEYSAALLNLSAGQHTLLNGPLAFGENDTKTRVKNILYYKKPVIWVLAAALLVLGIAAAVLLTNRRLPEDVQVLPEEQIAERAEWLTEWLTCQIPRAENVVKAEYQEDIGVGLGGELLIWTGESQYTANGGEGLPPEWASAGGVMRYPLEAFTFVNGTLTDAFLSYNHSSIAIQPQILDGCEEQAVIFMMNHDLYTAPELYEAEQSGHPVPENESTVDMWYVGFAREDSEYGYFLFLNGRYYNREDIVAFARSVHFTDAAWSKTEEEQQVSQEAENYNQSVRNMRRDEELTWSKLEELVLLENPTLKDYAGYDRAEWSEHTNDLSNIREELTYYLSDGGKEDEYHLNIIYYIENNEIWLISLTRMTDQSAIVLYNRDGDFYIDTDIAAFRQGTETMSDWVSYTVPKAENIEEGEYSAAGGYGYGGIQFTWTGQSDYATNGSDWSDPVWKSAGGIMRYPVMSSKAAEVWDYMSFLFEDGEFTDIAVRGLNHTSKVGVTEKLRDCEEQAVIFELNHDLFTASDILEAEESDRPIPEKEQTVDIWYAALAREDAPYGYIIYLNARYYDKEDIIQFAESLRFTEGAWLE